MAFKALVVDIDRSASNLLSNWLSMGGHEVFQANDPQDALRLAKQHEPHLMFVEIALGATNGIEFVSKVREEMYLHHATVVAMSKDSESFAQVAAFNSGADDFILKPIKKYLFDSKVKAWTRRFNGNGSTILLDNRLDGLELHPTKSVIKLFDTEHVLPQKEFDILQLLLSKPGKVFSRDEIREMVWTRKSPVRHRTIDVHIHRLREKLGEAHIRTIKGVGYKFEP